MPLVRQRQEKNQQNLLMNMETINIQTGIRMQDNGSEVVSKTKRCMDLRPGTLYLYYFFTERFRYISKIKDTSYPQRSMREFYFEYNLVRLGNYWEMDIIRLPYYRERSTSASIIHTMPSARSGRKICIARGHEPRTEEDAKKIARAWSDMQAEYIITGKTPDEQIAENQRKKEEKEEKEREKKGIVFTIFYYLIAFAVYFLYAAEEIGTIAGIFYSVFWGLTVPIQLIFD